MAKDGSLFRRATKWARIGFAVAFIAILAFIVQTVLFKPDREQITIAQQTAQAESTARAEAQATAQIESTRRIEAQATAQSEATARAAADRDVEARRLATQAQQVFVDGQQDLALALALASAQYENPSPEVKQTLAEISYAPSIIDVFDARCAQFSPNGQFILLVDDTSKALVQLDSKTRQEMNWCNLESEIYDFDMHPDAEKALVMFTDGSISMWDFNKCELIYPLLTTSDFQAERFVSEGKKVRFSPEGQISVATIDDSLIFWNTTDGERISTINTGLYIADMDWKQNEQFIMTSHIDRSLRLWDTGTGQEIIQMHKAEDYAARPTQFSQRIDVNKNGDTVAVGFNTFTPMADYAYFESDILLWDIEAGILSGRLKGPSATNNVAFSPDGLRLLSSKGESPYEGDSPSGGDSYLWRIYDNELLHHFYYHQDSSSVGIDQFDFSPNGPYALHSYEGKVYLIDLIINNELLNTGLQRIGTFSVNAAEPVPERNAILLGGFRESIRSNPSTLLVGMNDGRVIYTFDCHQDIHDFAILPDGHTALEASDSGIWKLDLDNGQVLNRVTEHNLECVSSYSDGTAIVDYTSTSDNCSFENNVIELISDKWLLTGWGTSDINLWDIETNSLLGQFKGHTSYITDLDVSPDGKYIASGSDDHSIRLWDLESLEEIRRFEGHQEAIIKLHFTPDGQRILSASNHRVRMWDVESGGETLLFTEDTEDILDIALSPDGKSVLVAVGENLNLLDIDTGQIIYRSFHELTPIEHIFFLPSGNTIAFTSSGTVDSGILHVERLIASWDGLLEWTYANRYVRELTCEERIEYAVTPLCND